MSLFAVAAALIGCHDWHVVLDDPEGGLDASRDAAGNAIDACGCRK